RRRREPDEVTDALSRFDSAAHSRRYAQDRSGIQSTTLPNRKNSTATANSASAITPITTPRPRCASMRVGSTRLELDVQRVVADLDPHPRARERPRLAELELQPVFGLSLFQGRLPGERHFRRDLLDPERLNHEPHFLRLPEQQQPERLLLPHHLAPTSTSNRHRAL